ncbi:tRNA (5-methylaminomethyl-2-thiouridine)(34)-methyltransferase MnmD [Tenacibaculum sp. SG-28]|uniref:tRNA (5-methylaminomethyl-2-thiouridine)(34)-methyltransferase MnmD n=1 Tax=Tenacibaculum sp. SG-28 TaxID=754426 RepID=UPI000CF55473|nr:tRNA (5-methylaminomethyl-2-thiouridine)(34)-methyltransferase MnmD [Tenacibaculum sp. SG-28]PQJ22838.1 SAM-dependent methyltransferase [Tenacibaculum sp. SG-28]
MKREIITTADGSNTIHIPEWNEQYHSKHGAIQEAYHVFIRNGLEQISKENIAILEIGFGTGLNCLITLLESNKTIHYIGVEAYPVALEELKKLNYTDNLNGKNKANYFQVIHACPWDVKQQISKQFSLTKQKKFFQEITDVNTYDLIYFDAFGARVQPELWTEKIFTIMYNSLRENGILVTYAAKGTIRRAMIAVGFSVERLPGPPGKREMLRATK